MGDVLISIHPVWCMKIMTGIKNVELRKTKPKRKPPFRCFVYQTVPETGGRTGHSGRVIGEFVCSDIIPITEENKAYFAFRACVSPKEMMKYSGGKPLYAWIISYPVRFSEPRPLSLFGLKHPPMSWCYVTEVLKDA